ncbi:cytochrome P450 [Streptosporangium nondiastaticum]|uniref:Cytochrome P450 n=2 Tax=Streptosporangium nondiastaticum TaxID=35764 RepID=A0A9X7PK10_9ACTN|nr:cytochrome P450 [Streptosporangium nondiastaticum]
MVEMLRFRRDPLGFVENYSHRSPSGVFRLPWGAWCVGDSDLALVVLRDPAFNTGTAPFFGDLLPSRPAQNDFGHAVRNLVRARLPEYRVNMAKAAAELPEASQWPATGAMLVYRCTADLLLQPDASPTLRRSMEQAVRVGSLVRAPHMWQRALVEMRRPKLKPMVVELVTARRREGIPADEPRDLLDTLIAVCPDEVTSRELADLYLLMFLSIVGTVGHSVAWSLLLACLHGRPRSSWPWPADWIAREAARHRPVVWMVGRSVPRPTEFGGVPFQPGAVLSVSPYLLHHDENRWTRPGVFRPERWAEPGEHGPYVPFSSGPFICAGAAVAQTMISDALTALADGAHLTVTGGDLRPFVTNAAICRPFVLHRTTKPRGGPSRREGGEQP